MSYDEKLRAIAATADIHDRCARLEVELHAARARIGELEAERDAAKAEAEANYAAALLKDEEVARIGELEAALREAIGYLQDEADVRARALLTRIRALQPTTEEPEIEVYSTGLGGYKDGEWVQLTPPIEPTTEKP